jgi:hypothetical protein
MHAGVAMDTIIQIKTSAGRQDVAFSQELERWAFRWDSRRAQMSPFTATGMETASLACRTQLQLASPH